MCSIMCCLKQLLRAFSLCFIERPFDKSGSNTRTYCHTNLCSCVHCWQHVDFVLEAREGDWRKYRDEECIYIWLQKISNGNKQMIEKSKLKLSPFIQLSHYDQVYNQRVCVEAEVSTITTNRLSWFVLVIYLIKLKLSTFYSYVMPS